MKRQNFVVLDGYVQECTQRIVDTEHALALIATLVTDHPAYGGYHRVLFNDRLAVELQAFLTSADGTDLKVTVDGWLRSLAEESVVVVDRAMFHVSEETRQKAARGVDLLLSRGTHAFDVRAVHIRR